MSTAWYYLTDDNKFNKKGPVSLEFLMENVPSDCLISNDEMLESNTNWVLLSEWIQSQQEKDSLIANNHQKHKQIEIKIRNTQNKSQPQETASQTNETKKVVMNTSASITLQKNDKNNALRLRLEQHHKEKVKKQVLNLNNDKTFDFDEEWFILSAVDNKTLGPFTRWQLVKKFNADEINRDTITFLNGSKEFRYLKRCGELVGVLQCVERDATVQQIESSYALTKHQLESKQYLYKDAYQRHCGPISLSEIFYKLENGILGRNSQIKQENETCWKTVEFIQKQFSREWKEWNENMQTEPDQHEMKHNLDPDPSFQALIELDKKHNTATETEAERKPKTSEAKNKRKKKRKRARKKQTKSIYVSGLPADVNYYEVEDFFKRAGVIATNIYEKGRKMIALYKEKGAARVTYHQVVSVKLAIDLLDETEIRHGYPVHIEVATDEEPNNCKKRKINRKDEKTLKKLYGVQSQLTWNDDVEESVPKLHWIVLQNVWTKQQKEECRSIESFFGDLKKDVINECAKIGPIDKYELYEESTKGIIRIKYKFSSHAALCINKMHRRYFDGNIIDCFYWDGTTDYSESVQGTETIQQQKELFRNFQL